MSADEFDVDFNKAHKAAVRLVTERAPELAERVSTILCKKTEEEVVNNLKKEYEAQGFKVETNSKVEVANSYIGISMVIENGKGGVCLVQVKEAADTKLFADAIGELSMRQAATAKKNALIIGLPEKPHDALIANAKMLGIQVHWPGDCTPEFDGNAT